MPDCHPVVKHYTGFDLSEESLVHSWYIADLWSKMTSYQPGEKLVSDEFHVGDTAFRLELYPNGHNGQPGQGSKGTTSIYLINKSGKDVTIDFQQQVNKIKSGRNKAKMLKSTPQPYSDVKLKNNCFYGGLTMSHRSPGKKPKPILKENDILEVVTKIRVKGKQVRAREEATELDVIKELREDFSSMLINAEYTDCEIHVEEEEEVFKIKCHKAMLVSRSDVFRKMFDNPMTESRDGKVVIKDVGVENVNSMIKWMYTGLVADLTSERAKELITTADMYHLTGLKNMCENKLMEKVDAKNAIDMLVVAEMYKANDLKRVAKDIIMEKGLEQNNWKEKLQEYPELCVEVCELFALMAKPSKNIEQTAA